RGLARSIPPLLPGSGAETLERPSRQDERSGRGHLRLPIHGGQRQERPDVSNVGPLLPLGRPGSDGVLSQTGGVLESARCKALRIPGQQLRHASRVLASILVAWAA